MIKGQFRLMKPLFFPLNYVDVSIADCRSRIAEFKCERELYRAFRSSTAIELRPGSIRLRVSDLRSSIVGFNPEHGAGNSIAEPQIDHGSLATEPALLSTLERAGVSQPPGRAGALCDGDQQRAEASSRTSGPNGHSQRPG